jgi:group II intron reverse transcriptase/maturase
MFKMIYKVSLDNHKSCIKASNSPINGNILGTRACLKRGLKEYPQATPVHGQVNKRQHQHSTSIKSSFLWQHRNWDKEFRLYIVDETQEISTSRYRISVFKEWADLNTGYRGCICKNSGYSKSRNGYGYGGAVVVAYGSYPYIRPCQNGVKTKGTSSFRLYSSTPTGLEDLQRLADSNRKNPKLLNRQIMKVISSTCVLEASIIKIKSKSGEITKNVDGVTLDKLSADCIKDLSKSLCTGSYKPLPVRLKAFGEDQPLEVPFPRDKIVQEAVRHILHAIYEPCFLDCSHGFRTGRSCHTALKSIKLGFGGVTWFIKGDISKCFDSVDHHVLAKILSQRIDDKAFFDLYWKIVRVGYVLQQNSFNSNENTLHGSVVSPLFSNIYLHNLDVFIHELKIKFEIGSQHKQNPEYSKLTRKKGIFFRDPLDPNFKRLCYVRYADDFLIGVIGSKEEATLITDKIRVFLKDSLKLDLHHTKTKPTHANSDQVLFLGAMIKIVPMSGFQCKNNKAGHNTQVSYRPQLRIPLALIVNRLEAKGILHKVRKTPTRLGWLIPFTNSQIVQYYNKIYVGLDNYYSFVDDRSLLQRIHYILKTSCVLSLASKLKLKTKNKVYSKYGKKLTIKDNGKEVTCFVDYKLKRPYFGSANYDPIKAIDVYFSFQTKPNIV